MTVDDQLVVFFSTMAGMVATPINLLCAYITQRIAWQRGYFRIGFVHGMLLGPLGLITVRVHQRVYQPTRVLQYQAHACSQSGIALYWLAVILLLGAMFIVNTQIIYYLAAQQILPSLGLWLVLAAIAIALGIFAYSYACPQLERMPPLNDFNDYPEEPEFAAEVKQTYEMHHFIADLELFRQIAVMCGMYFVLFGLAGLICMGANGDADLKPYGRWFVAVAAITFAGSVYCIVRYNVIKHEYQLPFIDDLASDDYWQGGIPKALRVYLSVLWRGFEELQTKHKWSSNLFPFCLFTLPTLGIVAAIDLANHNGMIPPALDYVLIVVSVLGLCCGFYLGLWYRYLSQALQDLELKLLDASQITGLYVDWEEDESESARMPEPAQNIRLQNMLDKCPVLKIPEGDVAGIEGVIIPRFYQRAHPSASYSVLLIARQVIPGILLALIILNSITGYIITGSLDSLPWFLGLVLYWILVAIFGKLTRIHEPKIELAPEWLRSGLDEAGFPATHKSQLPL